MKNLQQFDGANQIFINRVVEQSVHQVVESRQEDVCSVWRPLSTLHLRTNEYIHYKCINKYNTYKVKTATDGWSGRVVLSLGSSLGNTNYGKTSNQFCFLF